MINVILNDADTFDEVVHKSLTEFGDLAIVTKDNATKEGNPAAVITFMVLDRKGRRDRAQAVVTVRNLLDALFAVYGRYEYLTERKPADFKPGDIVRGSHRGFAWDAAGMKEVFLITIEGAEGIIGIGGDRANAKAVAEGLIDQAIAEGRIG